MTDKQRIEKPVAAFFETFQGEFSKALQSDIPTIQSAIGQMHGSNGKFIRPLLLLLTAQASGQVSAASIEAAVLLELLHAASLVHDDVVDDTRLRRGKPSMNAVYDNRIAVLVGDFILADALKRAVDTGVMEIVSIIASLCREMAEGEVKQLENADLMILCEADYLVALEKKTAVLLASCTEIGAITGGADLALQHTCREFGKLLGCAFQIKDDLFDYFEDPAIGKPFGNDLREGKVTLPLLYALDTADASEKAPYLEMLEKGDFSATQVSALIAFAKKKGGIEYAEARMADYKHKASALIASLPNSAAKDSLLLLADYLISRKK